MGLKRPRWTQSPVWKVVAGLFCNLKREELEGPERKEWRGKGQERRDCKMEKTRDTWRGMRLEGSPRSGGTSI